MSYATRHPQHPARLILASTAGRMDLDASFAAFERLGGLEARRIAARFWSDPSAEAAAEYMAVCMPLYNPGAAISEAVRRRAIMRTEVMFHFINGEQRTMDLLPGLARVACPTLVTAGGLDPITPVACGEAIAAALPAHLAELVVFDGAGHGVHRDEPERAEAVLRRFLNGETHA